VHPDVAQRLEILDGASIRFEVNETLVKAILHIDERVPSGVALVPRSLGIPVNSPVLLDIIVKKEDK
jgi:hypothetical protein